MMFKRAIARGEVRIDANVTAAVQFMSGILAVRTISETSLPEPSELDSLVDLVIRGCRA
jgi:hypothetical protein